MDNNKVPPFAMRTTDMRKSIARGTLGWEFVTSATARELHEAYIYCGFYFASGSTRKLMCVLFLCIYWKKSVATSGGVDHAQLWLSGRDELRDRQF